MSWNKVIRPTADDFTWGGNTNTWGEETRSWGYNPNFTLVARSTDDTYNQVIRPS